jgi:CRP-like cAMP-binding protein
MTIELSVLKALQLFSGLTREEGNLIIQNSSLQRRKRGEYVFMHGETIKQFYVICKGVVQIFRTTPDGLEVTSDMLIAGDSINVDDIITPLLLHNINARATEDLLLLEIPIEWIRERVDHFNHMLIHLVEGLSARLHDAQIQAEHQSTMSSAQIVACYLQRLCVLYGFDPQGFELPFSKTLIASRLHIAPETFSRTLKTLKEEGIAINGNQVSFTNMKRVGCFVCNSCSMFEDCQAHVLLHTLPQTVSHVSERISR